MAAKALLPPRFWNGEPTKDGPDAIIRLVAPFDEPSGKPKDQAVPLKLAVSG